MMGKGIFRWPGGAIYAGEWKDDRRHGRGFYRVSNTYLYYDGYVPYLPLYRGNETYLLTPFLLPSSVTISSR